MRRTDALGVRVTNAVARCVLSRDYRDKLTEVVAMHPWLMGKVAAVHDLVERARKISPSDRMGLYVSDVEVALGLRRPDTPEVRKTGGNEGSSDA